MASGNTLTSMWLPAWRQPGQESDCRFSLANQRSLLLKMSTVHARHAATVHDLLAPGSFANDDLVDAQGQIRTKTPTEAVAVLAPFFAPYVVSVANLPVPV